VGNNYGPSTTIPVTNVSLSHYYELIATAQPGVNAFTYQIAVDGVIQGSISGINSNSGLLAPATDTTGATQLLINLPRMGNFTVIDDIYLTDFTDDPSGNKGQLGVVNILGGQPAADVQTQFSQAGSATSHAAQVSGAFSNANGSLYSYADQATDVFSLNLSIPAQFDVRAVQAEALFSKYGTIGSQGQVGVISGTTAVAALSTANVLATVLQTLDPSTGQRWTISAAQSAKIAIKKTT
jgi:hypothetical protein